MVPLSLPQQQIWLLQELEPDNARTTPATLRLLGALDVPALRAVPLGDCPAARRPSEPPSRCCKDNRPRSFRSPGPPTLPPIDLRAAPSASAPARRPCRRPSARSCSVRWTWRAAAGPLDADPAGPPRARLAPRGAPLRPRRVVLRTCSSRSCWRSTRLHGRAPLALRSPPSSTRLLRWQREWVDSEEAARQLDHWRARPRAARRW